MRMCMRHTTVNWWSSVFYPFECAELSDSLMTGRKAFIFISKFSSVLYNTFRFLDTLYTALLSIQTTSWQDGVFGSAPPG